MLRFDICQRYARTGVALAHHGVSEKPFLLKHLSAQNAMLDIGQLATAINAGRIGVANAYVVQHRCLKSKFGIYFTAIGLKSIAQLPGEHRHLGGMCHQYMIVGVSFFIEFGDNGKIVEHS